MSKALRGAAAILAGLVFGLAVVALIATQFMGYRVAAIASDSMDPTLERGDLILTRPASIDDMQRDDIVLYETGSGTRILVVHRVVSTTTVITELTDSTTGAVTTSQHKTLRTKGDANDAPDQTMVDATSFRGELWLTIPGAGGLFASPMPFVLVAIGIGLLWLLAELIRWSRRGPAPKPDGEAPG